MEARPYISRTLLAVALSISFLVGGAPNTFAVTYGTYKNPFSRDSIWNLPIASGAKYAPAGLSTDKQPFANFSHVGILKVDPKDPLRKVYKRTILKLKAACGGINTSRVFYQVNLPDRFLVQKQLSNSIYAFVFPDGSIKGGLGFERCSPGSDAAQMHAGTAASDYRLTGNGLPNRGGVGASQMGVLGGVIRSGELTSSSGAPIPHALKLVLQASVMYYNSNDSTPGYTWPAKATDGYARARFTGKNPYLEVGSLLALHPNYSCGALRTEPGKKVCRAFQTYGAYVVDTLPGSWGSWALHTEINTPEDRTVERELQAKYGINVREYAGRRKFSNQATTNFKADLDAIYNNLQVVTNTSREYAKGSGKSLSAEELSVPTELRLVTE